jgi:hypothetical protein
VRPAVLALTVAVAASCAGMRPGPHDFVYTPEQAIAVQRALRAHGYPVELADLYGPDTRDAVARFQRANQLQPTGEMDAPTARALGLDPAAVQPIREQDWVQDQMQSDSWRKGD